MTTLIFVSIHLYSASSSNSSSVHPAEYARPGSNVGVVRQLTAKDTKHRKENKFSHWFNRRLLFLSKCLHDYMKRDDSLTSFQGRITLKCSLFRGVLTADVA